MPHLHTGTTNYELEFIIIKCGFGSGLSILRNMHLKQNEKKQQKISG